MINVETERRSIEFLKQPLDWPCWPACPVRRKKGDHSLPDTGVVFDDQTFAIKELRDAIKPTVYRVCIFSMTAADLDSCEKHEYESVEALVADGWEVD